MTRKAGELSKIRLKMLEIMVARPEISTSELSRLVGVDEHTGAKYRIQINELILTIKTRVEQQIAAKIDKGDGLWQKFRNLMK